jgi:RHS repeat-associated protein
VYGPGRAVDQPLSVTRYAYRDRPGTGQPTCPSPGDTTSARCVLVQWPLLRSAYDRNRGGLVWPSWQGSLLEAKRDGSGWEYKRARVYDPQTGRFTQEDPIGLAGGLNLYGFANGDPVNFSDPFGLCPPADDNFEDCAPGSSGWYAYRIATGRGNRILNEIGGTLATCGESGACWATLAVGGLVSGGLRLFAARGAAAEAASGAEALSLGERTLLRDFFGQGIKGARARAADFQVPEGLTRETLSKYAEIAERQIARGLDKTGVQAERLKLIQRALDLLR